MEKVDLERRVMIFGGITFFARPRYTFASGNTIDEQRYEIMQFLKRGHFHNGSREELSVPSTILRDKLARYYDWFDYNNHQVGIELKIPLYGSISEDEAVWTESERINECAVYFDKVHIIDLIGQNSPRQVENRGIDVVTIYSTSPNLKLDMRKQKSAYFFDLTKSDTLEWIELFDDAMSLYERGIRFFHNSYHKRPIKEESIKEMTLFASELEKKAKLLKKWKDDLFKKPLKPKKP